MSKIENKIITVLILLACLLLFNTGYAKHTNASSNTALAFTNKQLDLGFTNAKVIKSIGANEKESYIKLTTDKKSLNLNVSDLAYPGAEVEFSVDIVNTGILPAKVDSIKANGFEDNNAIKIKGLENINNSDIVLHPGDSYTLNFAIYWDRNYNIVNDSNIMFNIKLNFSQNI